MPAPNTHTIRRFRAGDEHALFQVFFSAIHELASRDYLPEQIQAWAPRDLDPAIWAARVQGIAPFVAERDGVILGYADVQPNGYIDHFFVSGKYARQGVGTALMQRIHEEAVRLRIPTLTSEVSLTAQPFYAKHGFVVVRRQSLRTRGVTLDNALMKKELIPTTP